MRSICDFFDPDRGLTAYHQSRQRLIIPDMSTSADASVAASTAYEPVIGLEVHVQLLTASKIFAPAPRASAPRLTQMFARSAWGCRELCRC